MRTASDSEGGIVAKVKLHRCPCLFIKIQAHPCWRVQSVGAHNPNWAGVFRPITTSSSAVIIGRGGIEAGALVVGVAAGHSLDSELRLGFGPGVHAASGEDEGREHCNHQQCSRLAT